MPDAFRDSFRAPADPAAIGRVHEVFERLGDCRGDLSESVRSAFELAVVEIVTNVVVHSDSDRTVTIELVIRTTADGLEAVITDDALPAALDVGSATMPDPEDLTESGRGLALVTSLVDRFEHEPFPDGNRWTLTVGSAGALGA